MSPTRKQGKRQKLPAILILYTGGTFGMETSVRAALQAESKSCAPTLRVPALSPSVLKRRLLDQVPQIQHLARCDIDIFLNRDSAHIGPTEWISLAERVQSKWKRYDGVVILHGTDTLAYTASALSFLLNPSRKPIVITGAQLPLGSLLTDARRNLLSAIEVAAHGPRDLVNQVTVFFDDLLLQGNLTRKRSASEYGAFESPKAEPLARAGTTLRYADPLESRQKGGVEKMIAAFSRKVALLDVTPGIPSALITEKLLPSLDGLVLKVFPSGTAPTHDPDFVSLLREAKARRIPVIAVTDGTSHSRQQENPRTYEAGRTLLKEGCLWAEGMTPECAYVKAAWILGQPEGRRRFKSMWRVSFAGENQV